MCRRMPLFSMADLAPMSVLLVTDPLFSLILCACSLVPACTIPTLNAMTTIGNEIEEVRAHAVASREQRGPREVKPLFIRVRFAVGCKEGGPTAKKDRSTHLSAVHTHEAARSRPPGYTGSLRYPRCPLNFNSFIA